MIVLRIKEIAATDLDAAGLESLADESRAASFPLTTFTGNVAAPIDIDRMIDELLNAHGRLDIIITNAGIMDNFITLAELDDELWNIVYRGRHTTLPLLLIRQVVYSPHDHQPQQPPGQIRPPSASRPPLPHG
ncbi:MAG: SDR family NAD(P)-dependent oxidoreductase [Candidatus Promineofilum sp.]|nr:SDR family NAD(P)-dependent oxidoreductase [Promineifilum sp.]